MSDVLQIQGINSKGFGTIPKLVMQDRRLTVPAKAIYGYFASYAGGGQTAFPGREKIIADLAMCVETYYRGLNQLKAFGYIMAEQERNPKGHFKRNIYTLMVDVPCTASPYTAEQDTAPCTASPYTVRQDTNTNSSLEYKQEYGNRNSPSGQPAQPAPKPGQDGTDTITEQDIQWQLGAIRDQIDYDALREANPDDTTLIDEIVSIILDVMVTPGGFLRIDREDRPRALVRHNLSLLDYENIELVISQFKSVTERINRKRQYLLTALYNVRMEFDAHYTNRVHSDLMNGGKRHG